MGTFIIDVDGTVFNILEETVELLRERGHLSRTDRLLYQLGKIMEKRGIKSGKLTERRYWRSYARLVDLLRDEGFRRELKERIRRKLDPEVIEKLRRLSQEGMVVLLSNSPHPLIKLLSQVLEEHGVKTYALGSHPVVGRDKTKFPLVLPEQMVKEAIFIDNPGIYARQLKKMGYEVILVRDVWLGRGKDLPSFKELRVEDLVKRFKK